MGPEARGLSPGGCFVGVGKWQINSPIPLELKLGGALATTSEGWDGTPRAHEGRTFVPLQRERRGQSLSHDASDCWSRRLAYEPLLLPS